MSDNGYIVISFGLFDNEKYQELMKDGMFVYYWLRRNIVRGPMKTKVMNNVFENYYMKHKLAVTIGTRKLGSLLGISHTTVDKILKGFKESGIVDVESASGTRGGKPQNVYILGNWKTYEEKGVEKIAEFWKVDDLITKDKIYAK